MAAPASANPVETTSGTGPYDAVYTTAPFFGDHTIYRPNELPDDEDLPIVAWGNGGCIANGTMFENFLLELASHGYLVIANGSPGGFGSTDADMLTEAVDWAIERDGLWYSEYQGHLDTDNIAVMGQSCGGLETYEVADDPRITTTALWNSGLLDDGDAHQIDALHAPIAYFTGGPSDIAHGNALDDWDRLPESLPAFFGSLDVGHTGTFGEPNGGEYGQVGVAWLDWHLKNDAAAGAEFVGSDCGLCDSAWEVNQRNLT
ncbi:alpha/beta hydrolase [Lipingzhangella sp. LS1_29]|uniref:poly(ethylene terephthalate) hydrolase n=2 Tax=Lipingzhangella rawalii TaxID=2055835 RepID=A0ABU2HBR0_9ACTN|nr:alpha/beta hydrolase [Lipingzhangella rawalii]MDS1272250.1 alpha/beta hydrolase [Lipingzhangella rawalii]